MTLKSYFSENISKVPKPFPFWDEKAPKSCFYKHRFHGGGGGGIISSMLPVYDIHVCHSNKFLETSALICKSWLKYFKILQKWLWVRTSYVRIKLHWDMLVFIPSDLSNEYSYLLYRNQCNAYPYLLLVCAVIPSNFQGQKKKEFSVFFWQDIAVCFQHSWFICSACWEKTRLCYNPAIH